MSKVKHNVASPMQQRTTIEHHNGLNNDGIMQIWAGGGADIVSRRRQRMCAHKYIERLCVFVVTECEVCAVRWKY